MQNFTSPSSHTPASNSSQPNHMNKKAGSLRTDKCIKIHLRALQLVKGPQGSIWQKSCNDFQINILKRPLKYVFLPKVEILFFNWQTCACAFRGILQRPWGFSEATNQISPSFIHLIFWCCLSRVQKSMLGREVKVNQESGVKFLFRWQIKTNITYAQSMLLI